MGTDLSGAAAFAKATIIAHWNAEKKLDHGSVPYNHTRKVEESFTFGAGAGNANQVFADTRLIGAGLNENIDFAGTLKNFREALITMASINFITIHNRSNETLTTAVDGVDHTINAAKLEIGPAAENGCLGIFKTAADRIVLKAGESITFAADGAGFTVTADDADLWNFADGSGGDGLEVAYSIIFWGVSA